MQTSMICCAIRSLPLRLPNSCRTLISSGTHQNRLYSIVENSQNENENPSHADAISLKADTAAASATTTTTSNVESKKRLIKVAVIGVPNAGKSSFINQFVDRRVSDGRI